MPVTTSGHEISSRRPPLPGAFATKADVDLAAHEREAPTTLETALDLIAAGRGRAADRLLTVELIGAPGRGDLWLAAGIARIRRGAFRSAVAALRMAVWIGDDPLARELLGALEL